MLFTITTTYQPATDLGYLLHKNPNNLNTIDLPFGQAHVFYSEVSPEKCTAVVLLDIDPVGLVRKKNDAFALEQYVNDRPYVVSSFMSVAIAKLFGTLLSGRSKDRPVLVSQNIPLVVHIPVLPCKGGESLLRKLFEPLGYNVLAESHQRDDLFPEWGQSPYWSVTLSRTCTLREFLIHLYVLIPVLDNEKHYWIGEEEITKLLKFGEGWLATHPEKEVITRRYMRNFRALVNVALARLSEEMASHEENSDEQEVREELETVVERKINLHQQRLLWVSEQLKQHGAKRIIDLGCGEGRLLKILLNDVFFEEIVGCDVSWRALEIAKERLKIDRLPSFQQSRIKLLHTALTYRDQRLNGYDAATLVEVIEHLDEPRLGALQRVVFEFARPHMIIVTTPNVEYNALFENMTPGTFRHKDHRFEWTRSQFQEWAQSIANRYAYEVSFAGLGPEDDQYGSPTQAGIFILKK